MIKKQLILGVLFCSLFYIISCGNKKENSTETERTIPMTEDKPVEVSAMRLALGDFNYEIISNGTVTSKNKADLRFQTSEYISRIFVKNGDKVTKGQELAKLDLFKLQNAYNQAKENIEKAELDLEEVLIGRGFYLKDTANISDEEIRLAKIRSNYEQTKNNYLLAEHNLKAGTLHAPFSGIVANLFVRENNLPGADVFCTIIDDKNLEVVFYVLENELPVVNVGDKVIVSPFALNSHSVDGKIVEINPLVDKNGMVRIKASVSNAEGKLYEGMNVKIRVQRFMSKQLVVPKTSLLIRSNRKVIFTLNKGYAKWVYVETGQENSDSYVVTNGLNEGDSVIYKGNLNLAHESPIILVQDN